MKVLIVARTRAPTGVCVGGIDENDASVRLLGADGSFLRYDSPFEVGEVWDLRLAIAPHPEPPHVEDRLIRASTGPVAKEPNLRQHLLRRIKPWKGGASALYEGHVRFTGSGSGYIQDDLPSRSTWFWLPDADLTYDATGNCYRYDDGFDSFKLAYVGTAPAVPTLPAGTLVRVSLARWWKPDDADDGFPLRCYMQLSGWY